jgi:magnesium and cobalt exporter, CNNM family
LILNLILLIVFLIGAFLLQTTSSAFRVLEHSRSHEQLKGTQAFFFFRSLTRLFFAERELEVLFFCISSTKHLVRFGFAATATLFFVFLYHGTIVGLIIAIALLLAVSLLLTDILPRVVASRYPTAALRIAAPIASLFLLLASPILLPLCGRRLTNLYVDQVREPVAQLKEKIIEMVEQAGAKTAVDEEEKRLLQSVAGFRDTRVREIMIPRVDMECLPETATVREAAQLFDKEGYSRFPIYRETVDEVVGLLLFKDLTHLYLQCETSGDYSALDQPVSTLLKPVLYIPEMARVTRVLKEFRQQQTHLAVVVDEYGGTEGLVTIEDCLEEIVGEISDEYDEEERLYTPQPDGSYLIDARMSINDIESTFGIAIPQEGDYDTIGGYAFHCAGEIPAPGMRIQRDAFDLEIVESSERCVDSVRLIPKPSK